MLKGNFTTGSFSKFLAGLSHLIGRFPINDPTTPNLAADIVIPDMGPLKYAVQGLSMSPSNPNEHRSLNCHIQLGHCINNAQRLFRKPLQGWSATKLLQVVPAAGADMNAYYDRRSLRFFYYNHKGRNVYFGDSADIVAHELGHAILDAMRPDFWSVQALEIWSFHEAFSDIVALFNLLNYDGAIESVLDETGGDLRRSNYASRLAEEVGRLIREVTGDPSYMENALRDPAVERFHYAKPSTLPKETRNDRLAAECHSFGRVFSAAWYEALVRSYEHEAGSGKKPSDALKVARDSCFSIILAGVEASPRVNNYYEAVARCMVSVAANHGESYFRIFSEVFSEWKIISSDSIRPLSSKSWSDIVIKLKKSDRVVKTRMGAVVSLREATRMKVSNLPIVSSLSLSSDTEIEVACDSYYEFDNQGNLVAEISSDSRSSFEEVAECMSYVEDEMGPEGMWDIKDGVISRKFIR